MGSEEARISAWTLAYRAGDHFVARDIFVRVEDVFGGVVGVDVGAGEVDGNIMVAAILQKVANPGGLRGCRSSDSELRRDLLEGTGGVLVEVEIRALFGIADPEVDIRFVPDFKVPLRDFCDTVAGDEVGGKGGDHSVPLRVVLRRGDILLVPEGVKGPRVRG